jgi:hypothetical protein
MSFYPLGTSKISPIDLDEAERQALLALVL